MSKLMYKGVEYGGVDEEEFSEFKKTTDDAISSLNSNLTADNGTLFRFGVDADGNYGYFKDGADSVTPFKSVPSEITYTMSLYGYCFSGGPVGSVVTIPCDGYSKLYSTKRGRYVVWTGIKADETTEVFCNDSGSTNSNPLEADISDYVKIKIDTTNFGSTLGITLTLSN